MLSVNDALALVLAEAMPGVPETVSLTAALYRVLAVDLETPHDSPPFDKALMDGFAVTTSALVSDRPIIDLSVTETVTAGRVPANRVTPTTAVRIMTGALLPADCDCVVPVERCQYDEAIPQSVAIPRAEILAEANLMRQGGAARRGTPLLNAGTRLQPQHIAALAEFGQAHIKVCVRPTVAVLATGDELVAFDAPLRAGAIRNSNEPMLLAQVMSCQAVPVSLGVAQDTVDDLRQQIQLGLQHDVLVLSGGVSAGTLDLVPRELSSAGVRCVFHGVDMKPGKPLWFGTLQGEIRKTLVFGLPGNPVSSLVCFELFVRSALRKISGVEHPPLSSLTARLSHPFLVKGNRPVYQPAEISICDGQLVVRPVAWNGSSDLKATVEANGMALMSPTHGQYNDGDVIPVWYWGNNSC